MPGTDTLTVIEAPELDRETRLRVERELKFAVRYNEQLMNMSVPAGRVVLRILPNLPVRARNHGTHIELSNNSLDVTNLRRVLVHEVAHYWWNTPPAWVSEGIATLIADLATGSGHEPLRFEGCPMSVAKQQVDQYRDGGPPHCAHYVGVAFFDALHEESPSTFRTNLRQLYALNLKGVDGPPAVDQAFASDVQRSVMAQLYHKEHR